MKRRDFLKAAAGAATATTLAGCASDLEGDSENDTPTATDEPYDETTTVNQEPEYELKASTPDEADLTNGEYFEFELYVERTLDGETEAIDPGNLEIKQSEAIRNHSEYDEETLKEQGLYRDIQELEQLDNRLWKIQKTDLIAGNNTLGLQVEFTDTDYDQTDTYNIEQNIQVEKTRDETIEDVWIDDPELWKKLRADYVQQQLEQDNWMGIAKQTENDIDLNQETGEMLKYLSAYWDDHADEKVDGQASGQAGYLWMTIEHISNTNEEVEELRGHTYSNITHNTVHAENNKQAWDVESAGIMVASPPREGRTHQREPEQTALMNTKDNLDRAHTTLESMIQLHSPKKRGELNKQEFEDPDSGDEDDYLQLKDELVLEVMKIKRESDTGKLPEDVQETMDNYGLSAALSPSAGLELTLEDVPV